MQTLHFYLNDQLQPAADISNNIEQACFHATAQYLVHMVLHMLLPVCFVHVIVMFTIRLPYLQGMSSAYGHHQIQDEYP